MEVVEFLRGLMVFMVIITAMLFTALVITCIMALKKRREDLA